MVFANKTYGIATPADKFSQAIKKRPVLYFGLPFVLTVVIGSFALSELTATKYNVHENRTKTVRHTAAGRERERERKTGQGKVPWILTCPPIPIPLVVGLPFYRNHRCQRKRDSSCPRTGENSICRKNTGDFRHRTLMMTGRSNV